MENTLEVASLPPSVLENIFSSPAILYPVLLAVVCIVIVIYKVVSKIIKGKFKIKNFEYDGTQNSTEQTQPQNKNNQANIASIKKDILDAIEEYSQRKHDKTEYIYSSQLKKFKNVIEEYKSYIIDTYMSRLDKENVFSSAEDKSVYKQHFEYWMNDNFTQVIHDLEEFMEQNHFRTKTSEDLNDIIYISIDSSYNSIDRCIKRDPRFLRRPEALQDIVRNSKQKFTELFNSGFQSAKLLSEERSKCFDSYNAQIESLIDDKMRTLL